MTNKQKRAVILNLLDEMKIEASEGTVTSDRNILKLGNKLKIFRLLHLKRGHASWIKERLLSRGHYEIYAEINPEKASRVEFLVRETPYSREILYKADPVRFNHLYLEVIGGTYREEEWFPGAVRKGLFVKGAGLFSNFSEAMNIVYGVELFDAVKQTEEIREWIENPSVRDIEIKAQTVRLFDGDSPDVDISGITLSPVEESDRFVVYIKSDTTRRIVPAEAEVVEGDGSNSSYIFVLDHLVEEVSGTGAFWMVTPALLCSGRKLLLLERDRGVRYVQDLKKLPFGKKRVLSNKEASRELGLCSKDGLILVGSAYDCWKDIQNRSTEKQPPLEGLKDGWVY